MACDPRFMTTSPVQGRLALEERVALAGMCRPPRGRRRAIRCSSQPSAALTPKAQARALGQRRTENRGQGLPGFRPWGDVGATPTGVCRWRQTGTVGKSKWLRGRRRGPGRSRKVREGKAKQSPFHCSHAPETRPAALPATKQTRMPQTRVPA